MSPTIVENMVIASKMVTPKKELFLCRISKIALEVFNMNDSLAEKRAIRHR